MTDTIDMSGRATHDEVMARSRSSPHVSRSAGAEARGSGDGGRPRCLGRTVDHLPPDMGSANQLRALAHRVMRAANPPAHHQGRAAAPRRYRAPAAGDTRAKTQAPIIGET